jgi:hypothetical protein
MSQLPYILNEKGFLKSGSHNPSYDRARSFNYGQPRHPDSHICLPHGNSARINILTAEESLRTEVSHQKRIYYGNLMSNPLST